MAARRNVHRQLLLRRLWEALAAVLRVHRRGLPPLGRLLEGVAVQQVGVGGLDLCDLRLHENVVGAESTRRAGRAAALLRVR